MITNLYRISCLSMKTRYYNLILLSIVLLISLLFITTINSQDNIDADAQDILKKCILKSKNQLLSKNKNTKGFHCKIGAIPTSIRNGNDYKLIYISIFYSRPNSIHIEYIYNDEFMMIGAYNNRGLLYIPEKRMFYLFESKYFPTFTLEAEKTGIDFKLDFNLNIEDSYGFIDIDISSLLELFLNAKEISLEEKIIKDKEIYIITTRQKGEEKWVVGKAYIFAKTLLPYQIVIKIGEKGKEDLPFIIKDIYFDHGKWREEIFQVPIEKVERLFTIKKVNNSEIIDIQYNYPSYYKECLRSWHIIKNLDYESNDRGRVMPK